MTLLDFVEATDESGPINPALALFGLSDVQRSRLGGQSAAIGLQRLPNT